MANSESINVEFDTGRDTGATIGKQSAASAAPGGSWLDSVKYHLDPNNHTLLENVLASLLFVFLILVIALAATHGRGGGDITGGLGATCQSQLCLLRSANTIGYANLSASPCDDFYQYACGLAKYSMRRGPSLLERTIHGELYRENEDKIEAILRSPIIRNAPNSYERKVKTFFSTCVNDFLTERIRGAAMALYLSPDLYLINASTVNSFDMTVMLLKASMIYGADVFFEYHIVENFLDNNKYTISISRGGIGMPTSSYTSDSEAAVKHREAYSTYVRTIASFLVSDAEPGLVSPGALSRVDEFVLDVMEIEKELAIIAQNSVGPDAGKPPLDPSNMPTLTQMDYSYPAFSWSKFFGESFRPNAPPEMRVAVQDPDYLKKVSDYVSQRLVSLYPGVYKRMLSNYMNWRIISRHASDLSSGYVHARRELDSVLSVRSHVYQSRFDYCFQKARHFMRHGISALFVYDHLTDSSKEEIDTIYQTLKSELINAIDRLGWVDAEARTKSKAKVGALMDRIGYSPVEVANDYLDAFYETLNAGNDDYLLDMTVSWENFHRERQSKRLGKQPDRSEWDGATYDTNLHMNNQKMQLTVPAGILQWPIYAKGLPDFINYATLGQQIAAELIKSIDATGQLFDKEGNTNPMWATETILSYVEKATCLNRTFSGMRAGPYVTSSGNKYVSMDAIISRHLRNVIAAADGIRLALRTYQGSGKAAELPLPLAGLNTMQTFFVAWGQNYCYDRDGDYSVTKAETLRAMPEEIHVNGILSTMPEFAQTFNCPSNSRMAKSGAACEGVFYA